jgi:hypothetical protein
METTPRLGLPNLIAGQAQKEITHNEALQILDSVVAAAVEEPARVNPPTAAVVGTAYIVGEQATGDWSGHDRKIAAFTPGGWRLIPPVEGLSVFVKSTGATARYQNGAWQNVLGAKQPAIADIAGGATVDSEARAAIASMLGALRAHGLIAA